VYDPRVHKDAVQYTNVVDRHRVDADLDPTFRPSPTALKVLSSHLNWMAIGSFDPLLKTGGPAIFLKAF